jgi:hypothetical protein
MLVVNIVFQQLVRHHSFVHEQSRGIAQSYFQINEKGTECGPLGPRHLLGTVLLRPSSVRPVSLRWFSFLGPNNLCWLSLLLFDKLAGASSFGRHSHHRFNEPDPKRPRLTRMRCFPFNLNRIIVALAQCMAKFELSITRARSGAAVQVKLVVFFLVNLLQF